MERKTYQSGDIDGSLAIGSGALETTAHGEELINGVEVELCVAFRDSLCRN